MSKLDLKVGILPQWQGMLLMNAPDGSGLDTERAQPQPGSWWLKEVQP